MSPFQPVHHQPKMSTGEHYSFFPRVHCFRFYQSGGQVFMSAMSTASPKRQVMNTILASHVFTDSGFINPVDSIPLPPCPPPAQNVQWWTLFLHSLCSLNTLNFNKGNIWNLYCKQQPVMVKYVWYKIGYKLKYLESKGNENQHRHKWKNSFLRETAGTAKQPFKQTSRKTDMCT